MNASLFIYLKKDFENPDISIVIEPIQLFVYPCGYMMSTYANYLKIVRHNRSVEPIQKSLAHIYDVYTQTRSINKSVVRISPAHTVAHVAL